MIGGEKEKCCGYTQPNTSNNSMKTHLLKNRHDRRREKRYVVVIRSLINTLNNSMKTHQLSTDMIRGEKRDMW